MGRAIVSMLRIWLVNISPAIGRPAGRTTLVGNGRTRDVIGHTTAKPVLAANETEETTSAGRRPACSGTGRSSRDRAARAASHIATKALRDLRDAPSPCLLGEGRGRTDALDGTVDALVGNGRVSKLRLA